MRHKRFFCASAFKHAWASYRFGVTGALFYRIEDNNFRKNQIFLLIHTLMNAFPFSNRLCLYLYYQKKKSLPTFLNDWHHWTHSCSTTNVIYEQLLYVIWINRYSLKPTGVSVSVCFFWNISTIHAGEGNIELAIFSHFSKSIFSF